MQIDVTKPRDGVAVLRLDGRLNMVSAAQLKQAITDSVDGGCPRVVVDLASVSFMDSSGLGALIAGLKKASPAATARIAATRSDRPEPLSR